MANLIIKPTSGGSLVLQDEGGDAALTVGTTGVSTIADATITAGTFPTGHVLKVTQTINRGAYTLTSGTTTVYTHTFTPTSRTNNLLIECIVPFQLYGNSATTNPSWDIEIYHNSTLIDNVHDVHNNNIGSNVAHSFVNAVTSDLIAVDHASASGSRAIETKAKFAAGRFYTAGSWYGLRITVWEIA